MVDWQSPAELALDAAVFSKFMHALSGLYFWEFATSLDFEWDFISGRKKFRWPALFYFAGRYCLLIALIGILVALDVTTKVNCQVLYTFDQLTGQAAVGFASINLALRTLVVWSNDLKVVIPVVLLICGHWSLILQGVLLTAEFVPGEGCAITHTNNTVLAATFIYSMSFDLIITLLSAWKFAYNVKGNRSQLMNLLFKDGLAYFFVAFLANFIATVFMCLNLNSVMSVIFNVPAAVFNTIVASRVVRRLTKFSSSGPEMFSMSNASANTRSPGVRRLGPKTQGVHVQMETFTVGAHDQDQESDYPLDEATKLANKAQSDIELGTSEIKHSPF